MGSAPGAHHPDVGPLTLHSTSLLMADDPMIRIVILYPAAASDAAKLERLARSRLPAAAATSAAIATQ